MDSLVRSVTYSTIVERLRLVPTTDSSADQLQFAFLSTLHRCRNRTPRRLWSTGHVLWLRAKQLRSISTTPGYEADASDNRKGCLKQHKTDPLRRTSSRRLQLNFAGVVRIPTPSLL